MVKRIPTPPPPEDEPRYLTVVHPYPLNANLELHADRRTLALWLACCTGKEVLFAMFHKPASPGMVVIEVDRDFDGFDKLLGLHTWSEFLQRPNNEQLDKISKVFYCTYNTGRLVEKNGWKRVNIEEHWFNGWTNKNSIIRYPYPKTSHCEVPSEAKTGAPMCRPLPQKSFPKPPPTPAPPVGSAGWLAARSANPTASPTPSSTRKSKKAAPSDTASVISSGSRSTKSFSPPPAPSPAPSSVMANYRAKNDGAWKRGPPSGPPSGPRSVSSAASAIASRAPSTVSGSSARSSRGPPRVPPGLGSGRTSQSPTSGRFDWSEDVERFESEQINNLPARSPTPSLSTDPGRHQRQPYDPDGPVEPSRAYDYTEEDQPRHSTVAAMSAIFDDDPPPAAPSVRSGRGGARPPGLDDPDYDPWNAPADTAEPVIDQSEACDPATPWVNYDAPRLEPPTKVKKKGEWTCPQHGSLCNPGICKERARVERDKRMRDDREKWEKEKREREAKYQKKRDREKKKAMGEGERDRPPHLRRGTTSSGNNNSNNNSDPDTDTSRDRDSNAPTPPDQGNWDIDWDHRGTDAQSTVSSVRRAWDSGVDSDDDDYDHDDDGTRSHSTHTSSAVSRNSRPPAPASVSSSGRSKGNAGPTKISPTSPRPPTRQSAWDGRSASAASQSPSMVAESVWPSVSGFSRTSSVSAASATGSDTGQHSGSGTRSASRRSPSDARSSVSSSARAPVTPSVTSASAKGFPTFADTHWGDPIAMALAAEAKEGGEESGKKASKSARKRRNRAKSAQVQVQAQVLAAQVSVVELEIQLPPGGPGSSWGDPDGKPW